MLVTKSTQLLTIILLLFNLSINQSYALPIGINTNEVMQIDSSVPFVDLFKMSLPFKEAALVPAKPGKRKLVSGNIIYDSKGWPKNLNGGWAGTAIIHWLPVGTLPAGVYTVLYDGEGVIEYGDDAVIVYSEPGKDLVRINHRGDNFLTVSLTITKTNPQNYIKNIRFLLPGGICRSNPYRRIDHPQQCPGDYQAFETHYKEIIFNPDYMKFMKDFKVIRFMNMAGISRNPVSRWEDLPKLDESTWAGKEGERGAPIEIMVALANKLNKHAWFNIPHRSDNRLVQHYARYIKNHLKPHLKVYLEYTNESWNPTFTHWKHMVEQGLHLGLDRDKNKAGHKYYVKRSLEIFNMWERIVGKHRLVRILGGWTPNTKLTELMLSYNNAYQKVDAIAIAPYFFVHRKVHDKLTNKIKGVPDVFQRMRDDKNPYSIQNVLKMIQRQRDVTAQYQVDLLAYEGGQHLVAYGTKSTRDYPNPFYIGANRVWPMEKMYVELLQGWQKITGNQLFVVFSSPRSIQHFGSWGIKEHINQHIEKAPKYKAIMRFLR